MTDATGASTIKCWYPYCEDSTFANAKAGVTKIELRNVYANRATNQLFNSDYGYVHTVCLTALLEEFMPWSLSHMIYWSKLVILYKFFEFKGEPEHAMVCRMSVIDITNTEEGAQVSAADLSAPGASGLTIDEFKAAAPSMQS